MRRRKSVKPLTTLQMIGIIFLIIIGWTLFENLSRYLSHAPEL